MNEFLIISILFQIAIFHTNFNVPILYLCSGMAELIGILVGHLYFFLKFEYAERYGGPSLLQTPTIL